MERWAVFYGADTSDTYNLGLVAADGTVVVNLTPRQQFHAGGNLVQGQSIPVALLSYGTSADRLYYLDGTTLKYVTPGGAAGTIRSLDGGSREYAFAVTPDDLRIAVAQFDYSTPTAAFRLWVEDLAGGNRVDLILKSVSYAWPFGWYNGQLIVVAADRYQGVSTEGPPFLPFSRPARLIDPTSGLETATLCSWPVAAHVLCTDSSQALSVQSWDGQRVPQPQIGPNQCYPTGVLSPDGHSIASEDFLRVPVIDRGTRCLASSSMVISDASGRRTRLGVDGYPEAFLDENHLIFKTGTNEFQHYAMNILDLSSGATSPIDFMAHSCRHCTALGVLPPFQS